MILMNQNYLIKQSLKENLNAAFFEAGVRLSFLKSKHL
jgi:hypothetical protein